MTSRHLASLIAFAAATLLIVSACTSGASSPDAATPDSPAASSPAPSGAEYVAMGDSYVAGPGIAPADSTQPRCFRSKANWPNLLAEAEGLQLLDVACSGATTETATDGLGPDVPPQLDALDADTSVVTVGLGGNDGNLFSSLVQACATTAATCRQYVDQQAPDVLSAITDHVADLLDQVAETSPDARIALVGYLRLAPETGTCTTLGVPADAADDARRIEQGLEDALSAASAAADVPFVSMREVSRGHDACASEDAWVNGTQSTDDDGIAFHPRSAGMQAVAEEVVKVL